MTHTYTELATNFRLWAEYADPGATMTEAEFDAMSLEDKLALLVDAFGTEQPKRDNNHDTN